MRDFKKYTIWVDSMKLVKEIYKLVEAFPKEEKYGLSSQICRASVSVPSNIAEGASRKGINDFKRFLEIALGSSFELETQLLIAIDLGFTKDNEVNLILNRIVLLQKQINSLIVKLEGDLKN